VILLVIHGPIATNIINFYTFGVAAQALDLRIGRRKLSIIVGCLSMAAVIGFLFASDFAHMLHNWIIAIAAWVATWGGIMAVHYFVFERRHKNFGYLFRSPRDTKLKAFNPAAFIAFFAGIVMTWMRMYGPYPILQGPIARAAGGIDFSWLAGTVTAAGLVLRPRLPALPLPDRSRRAAGHPGRHPGPAVPGRARRRRDCPGRRGRQRRRLAGPEPETAASAS
jgi:NCS1 family nucleobase:cation symporter-1